MVTVVPTPCGREFGGHTNFPWICGPGAFRCPRCESLGSRLASALYEANEYCGVWWCMLAANLCLAALLGAAAAQERERIEREYYMDVVR